MEEISEPVLHFQKNRISIEDYLEMEKQATIKHNTRMGEFLN
jgi:hypothetical protein